MQHKHKYHINIAIQNGHNVFLLGNPNREKPSNISLWRNCLFNKLYKLEICLEICAKITCKINIQAYSNYH